MSNTSVGLSSGLSMQSIPSSSEPQQRKRRKNQTPFEWTTPGGQSLHLAISDNYGRDPDFHCTRTEQEGPAMSLYGVSVYGHAAGPDTAAHWHYITYGLSEIEKKDPGGNPSISGLGIELSIRVPQTRRTITTATPAGTITTASSTTAAGAMATSSGTNPSATGSASVGGSTGAASGSNGQSQPGIGPDGHGRRCTHCHAKQTVLWRHGPLGRGTLCNACGVKWKRGVLKVNTVSELPRLNIHHNAAANMKQINTPQSPVVSKATPQQSATTPTGPKQSVLKPQPQRMMQTNSSNPTPANHTAAPVTGATAANNSISGNAMSNPINPISISDASNDTLLANALPVDSLSASSPALHDASVAFLINTLASEQHHYANESHTNTLASLDVIDGHAPEIDSNGGISKQSAHSLETNANTITNVATTATTASTATTATTATVTVTEQIEDPPHWPVQLLLNLALHAKKPLPPHYYLASVDDGPIVPGLSLLLPGPIFTLKPAPETELTAVLFVPDPQFPESFQTANGSVRVVQLVGITADEYHHCAQVDSIEHSFAFAQTLQLQQTIGPYLVTDLKRGSCLVDKKK